jgi:hypothetical protein
MPPFHTALAVTFLLLAAVQLEAAEPSFQTSPHHAFFQKYCFECHDSDSHKAGLKLDQLPWELADWQRSATWEKVFDKLAGGKMPPARAQQPAAEERQALIASLRKELHAASLARQAADGRVMLRRLNRTEYQNTLEDLLGVHAQVADLLPEDGTAAGFDDVADALDVSGVHLVRYQQAIDRALANAIPDQLGPPKRFVLTGKELFKRQQFFGNRKCWLKDEAMVMPWKSATPFAAFATRPAPAAGLYRIRATAYAVNTHGKSLAAIFTIRQSHLEPLEGNVQAWRDIPPDKPITVEAVIRLQPGQQVSFTGWELPINEKVLSALKDKPGQAWEGPALAIEKLEAEGPLDSWPPQVYQRLFGDVPQRTLLQIQALKQGKKPPVIHLYREDWARQKDPLVLDPANPRADAARLVRDFLPRAFRRPVPGELQQYYVDFVTERLDRGITFPDAMLAGYKAALCSPSFLFLQETPGRLDDYAIASRLSYFLWKSMPDELLLKSAAEGRLSKPEELDAQVERMLADPRSSRFSQDFAGQWLDLKKIDATSPDPRLYPEFDKVLQVSMVAETQMFFDEILRQDLSVTNFIDSDWTFLNARLARHYGIDAGIEGQEMKKVKLPPGSHRGGVMTQGTILKVTADGARTSPVLRGKWILDRLLGIVPPPPPADIPKIEPDIRGATTIRQQLAKHRSTAACNSCHRVIDPPGFALETFDPAGGWREFYRATGPIRKNAVVLANYPNITVNRGANVEVGDVMPDGRPFKDIDEYKRLLMESKDLLAESLTRKMITYATGADVQFADREVVTQIVQDLKQKNYGLRTLIHDVVKSRVFLAK